MPFSKTCFLHPCESVSDFREAFQVYGASSPTVIENVPSVTMFLRKDHHIFIGEDGKRRMRNLEESYKHAETKGKAHAYLSLSTSHIGLQDFKLNSNSGFIPGDVYAQSCFSLLISDRPCKEQGVQLNVLTISGTSRPELKTNDNSFVL